MISLHSKRVRLNNGSNGQSNLSILLPKGFILTGKL